MPCDLRDRLRAPAGGGVQRELQQEVLHRLQERRLRREGQVLLHPAREELQLAGTPGVYH